MQDTVGSPESPTSRTSPHHRRKEEKKDEVLDNLPPMDEKGPPSIRPNIGTVPKKNITEETSEKWVEHVGAFLSAQIPS